MADREERLSNHSPEFFANLSTEELKQWRKKTQEELSSHGGLYPDLRAIQRLHGDLSMIDWELRRREGLTPEERSEQLVNLLLCLKENTLDRRRHVRNSSERGASYVSSRMRARLMDV
jgi:hypothetical protein